MGRKQGTFPFLLFRSQGLEDNRACCVVISLVQAAVDAFNTIVALLHRLSVDKLTRLRIYNQFVTIDLYLHQVPIHPNSVGFSEQVINGFVRHPDFLIIGFLDGSFQDFFKSVFHKVTSKKYYLHIFCAYLYFTTILHNMQVLFYNCKATILMYSSFILLFKFFYFFFYFIYKFVYTHLSYISCFP